MGGGGDSAQSLKEGTARVPRRRKAKPLAWGPIINLSFAPPVTPSRVSPGRRTRVQRSADHLAVPRLERRWREERAGLGPCVLQECRLRRAPDPSPAATYLAHAGTAAAAPPRLGRARPGAWRCARAATAQGPAPAPPPLVRSPSPAPLDPTALSPREPRTPRAPPGPPPQPAPGPAPTDPCSPPAPPRPPPEPTRVLLAAPPRSFPAWGAPRPVRAPPLPYKAVSAQAPNPPALGAEPWEPRGAVPVWPQLALRDLRDGGSSLRVPSPDAGGRGWRRREDEWVCRLALPVGAAESAGLSAETLGPRRGQSGRRLKLHGMCTGGEGEGRGVGPHPRQSGGGGGGRRGTEVGVWQGPEWSTGKEAGPFPTWPFPMAPARAGRLCEGEGWYQPSTEGC